MSTSNEKAMRLALEALKQMRAQTNFNHWHFDICDQAIKALEAALEAHKALAKQSTKCLGEPVAEVKENPYCPEGHSDEITKYLPVGMKLYTTPQPAERKRKPLTDEQIMALLVELCVPTKYEGVTETFTAVVRTIEAAHGITKEKNTRNGGCL